MAGESEKSAAQKRVAKGKSLEREFAEWMEAKLGYTKTEMRTPITGKISERSYEVDIHGIKESKLMDILRLGGVILCVLAFVAHYTGDKDIEQTATEVVSAIDSSLAGNSLLIMGLAGLGIGFYGKKRTRVDAWVECKNQKTNVKRHQIQKLLSSVDDVRALEDPKWKPSQVILVSGTDFDADALNFAKEFNVICYKKTDEKFEKVAL